LWVWIGKNATKKERVEAMRNAQSFIVKKGYPNHTPVTRVIDGGEPLVFKSLYKTWKDPDQVFGMCKTYSAGGKVVKMKDLDKLMPKNRLNMSQLKSDSSLAAEVQMVDDGRGKKRVYRLKQFSLVEVAEKDWGNFFSGDCYLIAYTYKIEEEEKFIVYFWIGSKSSVDEKGAIAMQAAEYDNKHFNGRAVQVRVIEGKEPPHFTAMFEGKMIIYKGGFKSGFTAASQNEASETQKDKYLLQVRGTNKYVTRAVEVECSAASLNSNDVFVLYTPSAIFIWAGKGSTGDEREMAKLCAHKYRGKPFKQKAF
jgi:villin